MTIIKRYPALFSLFTLIVIYSLNKIPLSDILIDRGHNEFQANAFENIIFNFIISIFIFFVILKQRIPFSFNNRAYNCTAYYVPAIFYVFIFSGGFMEFLDFHLQAINSPVLILYGIRIFSAAFLEEILFRGLILGLLLNTYYQINKGALKAILISGLIFGCIHILNLWSHDGQSLKSVTNQIYATASLGVMYGAIYLKTRSIIVLVVLHFLGNFFAGIGELEISSIVEHSERNETSILTDIITEFFRLVIFGIPLLIGIFITRQVDKNEIEILLKTSNV